MMSNPSLGESDSSLLGEGQKPIRASNHRAMLKPQGFTGLGGFEVGINVCRAAWKTGEHPQQKQNRIYGGPIPSYSRTGHPSGY